MGFLVVLLQINLFMMNRILVLILLLCNSIGIYALKDLSSVQVNDSISARQLQSNFITETDTNKSSMAKKKQITSALLNESDEVLKERLELAAETISGLNSQINFYTWVMSILISVFGIVIPLLGYFFVIKPQSELKQMITTNIGEYLESNRKARIDTALEQLSSQEYFIRVQGLTTLQLLQPISFSENQIARVILTIKNEKLDAVKTSLASMLLFQNSKLADVFFSDDLLTEPTSSYYQTSILYYLQPAKTDKLREIFPRVPNSSALFMSMVAANRQNKDVVLALLNDDVLISEIKKGKTPEDLRQYNRDIRANTNLTDLEYHTTKFYQVLPHFEN